MRAMALLEPFRGVRPPASLAARLACLPYDVVNTEEARAYAKDDEACFFHVSRPEIDLPPGADEHSEAVYALGAKNLARFREKGWLVPDAEASFYLYRQRMGSHVQVGVVGAASVEAYERGQIKKHELTRPDKEDDRTRHIDALGGNDEPVFLTHRADDRIDALVGELLKSNPVYDFTAEDGIGHTFWTVRGEANRKLAEAFASVPVLYIADGHHRSAAASRACAARQKRGAKGTHDRFLAVVFPHDQMQILDYNRVVKDLGGLTPEAFLERLRASFKVEPSGEKKPARVHQFGLYLEARWYRLEAKPGSFPDTPLGVLDVNILQERCLAPLLGIGDPRTDRRLSFVGGIRGMAELEKLVDSGAHRAAFSMFPTSLDQLMAIADAGQIMPPKSTWFEPKLRSGLVLHLF
jgi:uncharacterized protein (DUF1015 family)